MRSKDEDWYKHYPARFLDGVRKMSPDLIGAYIVVLDLIYSSGDACHNDPAFIGAILNCNGRKAAALIDGLIKRGKLSIREDGRLINQKALQVLDARETVARQARDSGATGGRRSADARAATNEIKTLGEATLNRVEKSRVEKSRKEKKIVGTPDGVIPAKRRSKVPDEFPTSEAKVAAVKFWTDQGRPDLAARVEAEANQFRDHHAAHGSTMADWPAAWRTWLRNAVKFTKAPPGTVQAQSELWMPLGDWIGCLEIWYGLKPETKRGDWSPRWGAKPGEPGCRVPPEAMAHFRNGHRLPPARLVAASAQV